MGVVFDEVTANVETPQPAVQNTAVPQRDSHYESDEHKIMRVVETQQRRQQRLMAD